MAYHSTSTDEKEEKAERLVQLKHFTPDIIYQQTPTILFDLERDPKSRGEGMMYRFAQLEELYRAYQSLDRVIEGGLTKDAVTADLLEKIVHYFHRCATHTLLSYVGYEELVGVYSTRQMLRWHDGTEKQTEICTLLEQRRSSTEPKAQAFLEMTRRYITEGLGIIRSGVAQILTIVELYHEDKLTPEDKQTCENLFKVCIRPREIPRRMSAFYIALVERLHACPNKDISNAAKLCAFIHEAFAGDIHPYADGNGRTVNGLINLIVKLLGLKTFIIRNLDDSLDATSYYVKAISRNHDSFRALEQHFVLRLTEASKQDMFTSPAAARAVELRIEASALMKKALRQGIDVNHEYAEIVRNLSQKEFDETVIAVISEVDKRELNSEGLIERYGPIASLMIVCKRFKALLADTHSAKHLGRHSHLTPHVVALQPNTVLPNILMQLKTITEDHGLSEARWESKEKNTVYMLDLRTTEKDSATRLARALSVALQGRPYKISTAKNRNSGNYLVLVRFQRGSQPQATPAAGADADGKDLKAPQPLTLTKS